MRKSVRRAVPKDGAPHVYIAKKNETPHIGAFGRNLRHDIQGSMVGTTELESVTSCMSSKRSNRLSYAPV